MTNPSERHTMTVASNNNTTTAATKVSYLESVKQDGLTYLESVMQHEAAETDMKLKIADMTTPVQIQRAFRARLRHEIAALRKDRKIALKSELERIEAQHVISAGHSVNFARDLRNKLDQRKLAEVELIDAAIAEQTEHNRVRMSDAIKAKFSYDSVVTTTTQAADVAAEEV